MFLFVLSGHKKTRCAAGRERPYRRRCERGRGHQLLGAVLGNPIPFRLASLTYSETCFYFKGPSPTEECRQLACAVKRRRFPVGASPTRQPLQPEATGAVMEVTKWLKPSGKRVTKYGDSASVQAVTRVNAEQASKRSMRGPTRLPYRGRLIPLDE